MFEGSHNSPALVLAGSEAVSNLQNKAFFMLLGQMESVPQQIELEIELPHRFLVFLALLSLYDRKKSIFGES